MDNLWMEMSYTFFGLQQILAPVMGLACLFGILESVMEKKSRDRCMASLGLPSIPSHMRARKVKNSGECAECSIIAKKKKAKGGDSVIAGYRCTASVGGWELSGPSPDELKQLMHMLIDAGSKGVSISRDESEADVSFKCGPSAVMSPLKGSLTAVFVVVLFTFFALLFWVMGVADSGGTDLSMLAESTFWRIQPIMHPFPILR